MLYMYVLYTYIIHICIYDICNTIYYIYTYVYVFSYIHINIHIYINFIYINFNVIPITGDRSRDVKLFYFCVVFFRVSSSCPTNFQVSATTYVCRNLRIILR